MGLSEKIQSDIVAAMKARDDFRLSVLRMIKAAIQLKEKEKIRKLEDAESIQLLQTLLKQRRESIDQFQKGGRPDLAEKDAAVTRAVAETGATGIKQMGAVVKAAKALLEGRTVDGKALSDLVRD